MAVSLEIRMAHCNYCGTDLECGKKVSHHVRCLMKGEHTFRFTQLHRLRLLCLPRDNFERYFVVFVRHGCCVLLFQFLPHCMCVRGLLWVVWRGLIISLEHTFYNVCVFVCVNV